MMTFAGQRSSLRYIRLGLILTLANIPWRLKKSSTLYPVPKLMNARELEQFYYDVMEETP